MLWVALVLAVVVLVALSAVLVIVWRGRDVQTVAVVQREPAPRPVAPRPSQPERARLADPHAEALALAREGRTVEAVKLLRERHRGLGLAQAKHMLDELLAGRPASPPPSQRPAAIIDVREEDITREIRENRLINAIALYREKTDVGLAEAKSAVEAMRDRMRAS